MSFQFNEQDPLARCAGETQKASDALQAYWLMGPGRSLRKLAQRYNEATTESPPTRHFRTLAEWSNNHRWQDRVARASDIERTRKRDEWRERRVELLEGFFGKTVTALQQFDGRDATLGQLTQAVRVAIQELRAEYDDLPTQRHKLETLNLAELTDEQLRRIAAGEDPIFVLATSGAGGTGETDEDGTE